MPTYVYTCADCEHRFEIYQSFSEDSLTECPECQGRLRKVYNSVGVVFKGPGFYQTDSRAESKESNKSEKSGKSEKSSSASSETADSSSPASSGSSSSGSSTSSSSDSKAAN